MPENIYIYDALNQEWLHVDEQSWTKDINDAACFFSRGVALDIAKRQRRNKNVILMNAEGI